MPSAIHITHKQLIVCGRWLLTLALFFALTQTMSAQESDRPQPTPAGGDMFVYLPAFSSSPPIPTLNAISRPNSANEWTVSWSDGGSAVSQYELQESTDSSFSTVITYTLATTSQQIQQPISLNNNYYYRVRTYTPAGISPWSNSQSVMGGYRDDFDNSSSGWQMRRTTNLSRVLGNYTNGRYEVLSDDGNDWGIFSPLRPAPTPPYMIEYRSKIDPQVVASSHGAVFGGDWTGAPCPDYSTLPGVYEHNICFNHFYNTNLIWYVGQTSALQLIFERVDFLVWCPGCGGSPMKRLTNNPGSWVNVNPVPNVSPNDWNTWRIEVRNNGIKLFANGQQYASSPDTTWVNDPYFGLFVSSSTYEPARWYAEYYQVTYLDN